MGTKQAWAKLGSCDVWLSLELKGGANPKDMQTRLVQTLAVKTAVRVITVDLQV